MPRRHTAATCFTQTDAAHAHAGGACALYHGARRWNGAPNVPATSAEDREIGRLAGFYTTTCPHDAGRFGEQLIPVTVTLACPLHVYGVGPGDPGMEIWETLTGRELPEPDDYAGYAGEDIAATVTAAGHDGVVIHHADGRRWHIALAAGAAQLTSPEAQPAAFETASASVKADKPAA